MMVKIFTKNKDGKIDLTPEELKSLLDEAYWEGYRANSKTITYTTPSWSPYIWTGSSITSNVSTSNSNINTTANLNNDSLKDWMTSYIEPHGDNNE